MRHPRTILPFIALTGWLACNGKLFTITVDESSETTIPEGTLLEDLLGDLGFDGFLDMDITASEEVQNQGVGPGDIKDVSLVLFELEVTDPTGGDLSFLDSMDIYVEAPDLDRVLIASREGFPKGQALVSFDLENVDLTDYVVSQSMTIATEVTGHRPDDDTTVLARFELDVGVTGKGCRNAAKDS